MDTALDYMFAYIKLIRISDIVDIALVAIIIFYLLKWLRETRSMQLVKGIVILLFVLIVSRWLRLTVINYILSAVLQVGFFALVVIFQPELRSFLERIGRSKFGRILDFSIRNKNGEYDTVDAEYVEILDAVDDLSKGKVGALIVLERETKLGDHTKQGILLDAKISKELLENIFFKNSPLHDGAVIIRGGRIHSAGCLLPLTSNVNLSSELGTRHRAALGISEVSDALIIVVSEENGKVSIAMNGSLTRNVTREPLLHAIEKFMTEDEKEPISQFINFVKGGPSDE